MICCPRADSPNLATRLEANHYGKDSLANRPFTCTDLANLKSVTDSVITTIVPPIAPHSIIELMVCQSSDTGLDSVPFESMDEVIENWVGQIAKCRPDILTPRSVDDSRPIARHATQRGYSR